MLGKLDCSTTGLSSRLYEVEFSRLPSTGPLIRLVVANIATRFDSTCTTAQKYHRLMQQTLFFIPHWLLDGPLLIAWLLLGALFLVWQFLKHGNSNEMWSFLPVFLIVTAVIYFVIPRVEVFGINPDDPTGASIVKGLAVRGYGLMLLTAIVAGVSIVMSRCEKIGVCLLYTSPSPRD